jgi:outer membrane beta-barrel protein
MSLTAGVNDLLNKGPRQGMTIDSNLSLGRTTAASVTDYPREGRTYFASLRYEFGGHDSSSLKAPAPAAAGDFSDIREIGDDGSFYIAPKLIYNQTRTDLSGEDLTFSGGPGGTGTGLGSASPDFFMQPNTSLTTPVFGGRDSQSAVAGGLAAGFDLYKLHGVPLRLEIEGSLHNRKSFGHPIYKFGAYKNSASPTKFTIGYLESVQYLETKTANLFLNAFWDFHNSTRFTPYIGAGLGASRYHHHHQLTYDMEVNYGRALVTLPRSLQMHYWTGNISNLDNFGVTKKGWAFIYNLAAGFSYQLSPATHLDFSYRYVDYGTQDLPTGAPEVIRRPPMQVGAQAFVMAYVSGPGQTFKMTAHQAVLALRFDLGAGEQSIAEYKRKKEGAISFFSGLAGPGPLDGPAVRPGSFTISPRLGGWFPADDLGLGDGYVGGLGLGYNFTRNWGLEASFDLTNHLSSSYFRSDYYSGQTQTGSARLNAVYHIVDPENENSRWAPYATAGLGLVWSKGNIEHARVVAMLNGIPTEMEKLGQTADDYQSFAVNAGLGVKYFLHEDIDLRLEVLDTFAFKDAALGRDTGPYHNLAVTGGLTFQFGGH